MREGKGFYWRGFEVLRAGFLSSFGRLKGREGK